MPPVKVVTGPGGKPMHQVGGTSFVLFRTPAPAHGTR